MLFKLSSRVKNLEEIFCPESCFPHVFCLPNRNVREKSRPMLFEAKKLEVESADELLQCSISTVKPYALMLAPVYVFMKRNEKFVSVKGPLDFFTPEELAAFASYGSFHLPKTVAELTAFQTAAKLVREMLKEAAAPFPPAPFELSDEMIKVVAPVWGKNIEISPFCAAIFSDELCGPLESQELLYGRDTAIVRHDLGLLLSGLLIFILVHSGAYDLEQLRKIRSETYSRTIRGEDWAGPFYEWESMNRDLIRWFELRVNLNETEIRKFRSEWCFKLLGRLKRVIASQGLLDDTSAKIAAGGFTW